MGAVIGRGPRERRRARARRIAGAIGGLLEARECDCGRHECEPGYLFLGSPLECGGLRGVAPCARAILRGVAGRRGRGLVRGGCACARLERFSFCSVAASSADGCRVARAW